MKHFAFRLALLAFGFAALLSGAAAQSLRDPTQAPAGAGMTPDKSSGGSINGGPLSPDGVSSGGFTIIVRNDKPHLAVGTRLYAQGQKLGNATIERITETAVWLREGRDLRKITQFTGIERRVTAPVAAVPACAGKTAKPVKPHSSKTAPRVTACADDQP